MKNETVQQIMRDHWICNNSEAREALNFVRDLVDADIKYTEQTEPYATKYIAEMKVASLRLSGLLDELE